MLLLIGNRFYCRLLEIDQTHLLWTNVVMLIMYCGTAEYICFISQCGSITQSVSDVSGGPRCEMCHWQCHLVTNTGHWSPVHSLLSHTGEHYCHWCNCHCSLLLTGYWTPHCHNTCTPQLDIIQSEANKVQQQMYRY